MPNEFDFDVCDGKSFRDICKDVVDRSQNKKDQIDKLFGDVKAYITNINDAIVFLPRIKELLDVGVKNDEQLIKLASVLQRLHSTQLDASSKDSVGLTEDEKDQLIKAVTIGKLKEIESEVNLKLI